VWKSGWEANKRKKKKSLFERERERERNGLFQSLIRLTADKGIFNKAALLTRHEFMIGRLAFTRGSALEGRIGIWRGGLGASGI
jgi:hypothetical protein